jgi:hypothetical protein
MIYCKMMMFLVVPLAALCLAGCGNVYLQGEGLTAAETSTMDAYQAVQRTELPHEPDCPAWLRVYLQENFKQWRFFVRSARKDETWGPRLTGEGAFGAPASAGSGASGGGGQP